MAEVCHLSHRPNLVEVPCRKTKTGSSEITKRRMHKNNKHMPKEPNRHISLVYVVIKVCQYLQRLIYTGDDGCYTDIQADKRHICPIALKVRAGATVKTGILPASRLPRWMCDNIPSNTVQAVEVMSAYSHQA